MKKLAPFSILIIVSFLVLPSVTFASWWNPFSWGIFHKTQTSIVTPTTNTEPIKTSEEKINELQKQLNDLKKQQPASPSTVANTTSKIVKNTSAQKTVPVAEVPVTLPVATTPPPFDACKNIEGIQSVAPDGMYADNGICQSVSNLDATQIKIQQAQIDAQNQAQNESQKEALQAKQSQLDAINLKIANLNAKYASDVAKVRSNNITVEQANAQINYLNSQYTIDYDALQAQWQQVKYSN